MAGDAAQGVGCTLSFGVLYTLATSNGAAVEMIKKQFT